MNKKFRILAAFLILTAFLSGCAGPARADLLAGAVKAEFGDAQSLAMVLLVTADYGDRVYTYKLRYEGSASEGVLTVAEPENIAGITARLSANATTLEFDGVTLDTGACSPDGLSPMDAIPAMLAAWARGYEREPTFESLDGEKMVAIEYELTETEWLRTWFDEDTLLPYLAEISAGGRTVIRCEFENVVL